MLYDPAQFERLTDEPWDPARVEDAIATIVADADAAFDLEALWPAHEWDGWRSRLDGLLSRCGPRATSPDASSGRHLARVSVPAASISCAGRNE